MKDHVMVTIRMRRHEHKAVKEEAKWRDMSMSDYMILCWRNVVCSGMPLQALPPIPVDPWVPPSQREGP